jgi:hypothetical protein
MEHKIGRSSRKDAKAAVQEACQEMGPKPALVIFIADIDSFTAMNQEMYRRFPDSTLVGTSSIAAFCHAGSFRQSLLVLTFESGIDCQAGVLDEAGRCPLKYVNRIENCLQKLGPADGKDTICLSFATALIGCEELVLSTLNSVLCHRHIRVFGGTAGDHGRAEGTMVALNGQVRPDACVFVLLRNIGGHIHLFRENIYKPTRHHFIATKVDIINRRVLEFNSQPAADAIADAFGLNCQQLDMKLLDSHPLGRMVGSEMYIVANAAVDKDHHAMDYHSRIYRNDQVILLEPDDYQQVNQQTIADIKKTVPQPQLSLMVNCLARTLLFDSNGYTDRFAREMGTALGDYIGFGGYGEQLDDEHFNQTMIAAVFS